MTGAKIDRFKFDNLSVRCQRRESLKSDVQRLTMIKGGEEKPHVLVFLPRDIAFSIKYAKDFRENSVT